MVTFKKISKHLIIILLAAFLLRLVMSPFGTLELDQNTFIAWSKIIAESGPKQFYTGWSDYLPGYVYVLWLLGNISNLFVFTSPVLYKLPAIFADVVTGFLIYQIVKTLPDSKRKLKTEKITLFAAAIYLFNPAIFANSSLWGQVDSFTALFSLAAVYFAGINPIVSAISLALGTLIKPQAALALIPVLLVAYRQKWNLTALVKFGLTGAFVFALGFVPFNNKDNLIGFISERLNTTLNQYQYTSVNAFNAWGLTGFWQTDTWQNGFGWIVTILLSLVGFIKLRKTKSGEYLLLAWVLLIGFLFMTRLHERHMLPLLAPLAVSVALYPSLIFSYIILSFTYLLNLHFAFVWITQEFKTIYNQTEVNFIIFLNFVASIYLGFVIWTKRELLIKLPKKAKSKLVDVLTPRKSLNYLIVILAFAFIARVINLSEPVTHYFDEVYHAFTAQVMLEGDPKAWEWWNPNPEGFAYEWTHPPLAKEAMVIGMSIFGNNAFGYRSMQAILGVLCVGLIYLIAKNLFKSRDIGILSAAIFALDGLPLTLSRIGMNDMYMLTFLLLSLYLFIKDKYFWSALVLGLGVATKWSIVWFVPILLVSHFALNKKFTLKYLWFLILPPLVYLAIYIPFFTSGHTVENFIELQKQMWWYHTRLVAEHSYSSSWWSWPFNLRPVWAYVNRDINGQVANIYLMGNPIVFWTGIIALVSAIYYCITEQNKKLGLVIFGFFALFATWAISPRIMFFYHYLPAFAFMTIIIGYTLKRNTWAIKPVIVLSGVAFIYFFPHWTGIQIPVWLDNTYYWLSSWR